MKTDGYRDQAGEPIAIVGMACRFPGAADLDAFWRLLAEGQNAVTEGVPGSGVGRLGELFPDAAVQSEACRFGAYLDGIDQFDAEFFRISPVEAQLLDPQQRLMLETSWRALEDAGMDPDRLQGSRTGVYAGISNYDYRGLILAASETTDPAASLYSITGTSFNTAIGRVAFMLGLHGPAIAMDTACSSSLVAVHQAVVGLQRGEADLALAGGVHTILSGRLLELRANAGMLAPDGQCKTFDAAANGYVRGEGCGILVLKRLREAETDGDRIWAVIRGSALNQDGTSPGLTVPNGAAQELVIAAALAQAGVLPSQVDYVEAHGTGTPVGDPIEMQAAGTAYGRGRAAERPLLIGSVKTNFGHLEAAAGTAGLIKTVLAMQQGVIPKHLHFHNPNPEIAWEQLPVQVTAEATPWPLVPDRPPLAGVSGFGWSGTNAHVVVEGYRAPNGTAAGIAGRPWPTGAAQPVAVTPPAAVTDEVVVEACAPRTARLLPLSGKTDQALRELAGHYLTWLDEHAEDLDAGAAADMAWTASVGRSHFPHRAGLAFHDVASLRDGLTTLAAEGRPEPRVAPKVAFAYTGQASQWVGMGQELYEQEPVARAVLDRCDQVLRAERGVSLLDVMFGRAGDLDDPAWTQPAIYALECALTALWASVGIEPSVVVGHSLGEIAAAQAAGVFTLEEGLRFAAARGALMGALPADGAMAAVYAPVSRVAAIVAEQNATSAGPGLCIAVDNGAQQVVSGPAADVAAVVQRFESEGLWARQLRKSPAYHSALVEPALDDLEAVVAGVAVAPPSCTFVSSLTGQVVEPGTRLDGSYWRRQSRQPVAFRRCIETLAELGVQVVVEIGPQAVLGPMVVMNWPEAMPEPPAALASLAGPPDDEAEGETGSGFVAAVAGAYEAGLPVSFAGLFAGEQRRRISLPGYPFQRRRHWIEAPKRRRLGAGHPLLGIRHESPRGEVLFETELSATDPAWLNDHRVFGRLVVPGALYAAMAVSAACPDGAGPAVLEDLQLHSPLILPEELDHDSEPGIRKVQVVLDGAEAGSSRRVEVFSRGDGEEGWTQHVEARVSSGGDGPPRTRADLDDLKAGLSAEDVSAFYRARAEANVNLDPLFRTLRTLWSGEGEAVGEVVLSETLDRSQLVVHPILLDGCFQVLAAARNVASIADGATYLPFGWERLWLPERLPERVICHARMREDTRDPGPEGEPSEPPEVLTGDLRLYTPDGIELGGLSGYTVKRATRAALLSATEELDDLLYEVTWRDRELGAGLMPADFFPSPAVVAAGSQLFTGYLTDAGVAPQDRDALLADLERWSWSRALATLEELGWQRVTGATVDPESLRQRLNVLPEHKRLFRRMLELLAKSGVLKETDDGFVVVVGPEDPLPEVMPRNIEEFATRMAGQYPNGQIEIGLFRRSGCALAEVLRGQADPLTLLFGSGEPTAADLYLKAPVARAANRMLTEAVQALVAALPDGRRLRVIEVGAGTGSATAAVLPELPEGQFDYTYTDISAGFFAEAEARFGDGGGCIEYRPLDIEQDPIAQGFDAHGYDLIIASNVLHATRYLEETLTHCRELLAPAGQLVALENLRGLGWMDLTFGQLDGWWRFADAYRPHHAMAGPVVWRQALSAAGFPGVEVLGVDDSFSFEMLDKGVIVAQGPAQVTESPGVWVLTADHGGAAEALAAEMAARNQTVVLAGREASEDGSSAAVGPAVLKTAMDTASRESWRSLIEGLPRDVPFNGVVHLQALDGHGAQATTAELVEDVQHAGASALALVQGVADSDVIPAKGVWFVTRGAQVLERERTGTLAGAVLWGLGKVVALETAQLQPRMIDLDPGATDPLSDLVNELLYPDRENHIAYRWGRRQAARLVRPDAAAERLALPEESSWVLAPDQGGVFDKPEIKPLPPRSLEPQEVRVAVEATGLNFWDVFRSLGFIEEGDLGRELCGHVLDIGSDVSTVSVGDRVVGLGFGAFGPEMVTREELVAPAPARLPASALATIPTAFVSAALSYQFSGLEAGERVLIHAGAGGVGLAAIQLAHAAGAEVFATASAPKQAYLRSLGVTHIFDSRQTRFGEEILAATGGEGVHVVLNSLTSEGFIEASLSCLARGGRFVELAARDILSKEEMAAVRPDVAYDILDLDGLKKTDPAWVGEVLRGIMVRLSAGELKPLIHSRWPLAEAGAALGFMRSARHIGKIVLTPPPLRGGQLRQDRTYLVTGGLGGIGCAVAEWLADQGAGAIVLNGRRNPDTEAEATIDALRGRGVRIEVELADVTDAAAVDAMLARIDEKLPPLGGVIHSVGVLSDAALTNQNWESFERVLWPKIVGAWHLHHATIDRDLDLFILFSSRVGVMGNPGQANHAAANTFLDQLAAHRRALGLAGQSIAWGAWSELGEAEEQSERIEKRLEAEGKGWITPQQGLRALEQLVRQDTTTSVVMAMDWSVFEAAVTDRPPLLEDLLSTAANDADDPQEMPDDLLSGLRAASPAEREQLLVAFLQRELQAVMRLPTLPVPSVDFSELGMDSLMAVELRNRLNRAFDGEYVASNTVVFDYPSIVGLAGHLAGELGEVGAADEAAALPAPEQPAPARPPRVQDDEDAIAIVGMACRFPGAEGLAAFWRQLEAGENAVTDGRQDSGPWHGVAGDPTAEDAICRRGAFVEEIDRFDSRFFRIAPIEARTMDPQQRLLLETSWQALEDAGIDPDRLKGSRTGVYAGIGGSEYRRLIEMSGRDDNSFGSNPGVAVGRIAFTLGLEGPAVPLAMACASSLVAVHQAAVGLERGEVDLALAGGVNAVLAPAVMKFLREAGMLSASGQCWAFDAAADGYVRGEGCGMVILKRLSEAEADGDRIWGVIRGSAVNQNGASLGLTLPNGPAQERVMEEALARAGVVPAEVDYMEAHGPGTIVGDPIEVQALATVYGRGRAAERPLLIGSVKTNIGHSESAGGIAGLIKTVLAMKQGVIPKHLHFRNPSPEIAWERLPVQVTAEATPWPLRPDRPPLAGVNVFGISGANAHVVVEGYGAPNGAATGLAERSQSWPAGAPQPVDVALPAAVTATPETEACAARTTRLLPLSGKTDQALRELAGRYLAWLDARAEVLSGADGVADAVLADMAWTAGAGRSHFTHRAGLVFHDAGSLRKRLTALAAAEVERGPPAPPPVAFAYTGHGSQWVGMGEALYQSEPVVRAVLDRCDEVVREQRGVSLLDVLFGRAGAAGGLDDPAWTQPAIYALECALTALWASVGIAPSVVVGHGLGELAAAQAAGMFTLEEGLRLAALPDNPEAALTDIEIAPSSCTFVSGLTGQALEPGTRLDESYWLRQAREPVAFRRCTETLAELGVRVVVEIGPQAVLGPMVVRRWPPSATEGAPVTLASLHGPSDDQADGGFVAAVAGAYEAGLTVSFAGLFAGEQRRRVALPGYPFQRRRHWIEPPKSQGGYSLATESKH